MLRRVVLASMSNRQDGIRQAKAGCNVPQGDQPARLFSSKSKSEMK